MFKYLKKSKLRKLSELLGYSVPALKDCTYKCYRGSEWLTFPAEKNDEYYKIYVNDSFISISLYLDEIFSRKELELKVFYGNDYKEILGKLCEV